jgi:tetratricopeptide (TPR) repeat protein
VSLLQRALDLSRETKNRSLEARALNNLGAVYAAQGQYGEAQTNFEGALAIREKAKAPAETADTLHNLGDNFTKMGRFDEALQRYNAALELRRSAGDRRNAALASFGIGNVFDYQGRYGAAANSKGEALKAFRELKQQDTSLVEILGGYGHSLGLSGNAADAALSLGEAMKLSEQLKNPNLIAATMRFQADRLFVSGDLKGAADLARKAAQSAGSATDRTLLLSNQVQQAIFANAIQPTRALVARLGELAQEADTTGLKSLSVECLVARAEGLRKLGDADAALGEADRALSRAEGLGLKVPIAKAHFVKAAVLRAKNDPAARREYAAVVRVLEEVRRDTGNENVLKRADLAPIHAESVQGSKT